MTRLLLVAITMTFSSSVISCGEKGEKGEEKQVSGSSGVESSAHLDLTDEISMTLEAMMAGVLSIRDVSSAQAFGETMTLHTNKITEIVTRAEALPEPGHKEKKVIRRMMESTERTGDNTMKAFKDLMKDHPDAHVIGKIFTEVMSREELKAAMARFKELYGLGAAGSKEPVPITVPIPSE